MNEDFEIVIDYQYDLVEEFHEDIAVVLKDELYGAINKDGEEVVEIRFETIETDDETETITVFDRETYQYLYYNYDGDEITFAEYCEAMGYQEDMLVAVREDPDWNSPIAFYSTTGDKIIDYKYHESLQPAFSEFNIVRYYDKYYVLTKNEFGTSESDYYFIDAEFAYQNSYYCIQEQDERYWIISDATKAAIFEDPYDSPIYFNDQGYALVERDGWYGFINLDGEEVVALEYESTRMYDAPFDYSEQSYLLLYKDGLYTIFNENAEIIHTSELPIEFYNDQIVVHHNEETNRMDVVNYKDDVLVDDFMLLMLTKDQTKVFGVEYPLYTKAPEIYDFSGKLISDPKSDVYCHLDIDYYNYSDRMFYGCWEYDNTQVTRTIYNSNHQQIIQVTGEDAIIIYSDGYILTVAEDGLAAIYDYKGNLLVDQFYRNIDNPI
ncbi:MAG: WG repeat-containing protein [Bacilli bacterium]|nr:WG repeat-containing protein [Bacilli bacterium]MBN2876067.1 WG repeat-containing protein [Bacilli bacterium]